MKKYLFLFALLLFLCTTGKLSAVNDSCLDLAGRGDINSYNPDPVKIDTCKSSPTYGKWYAKKTYLFGTKIYIFQTKPILLGKSYSWKDIDTNLVDVKKSFEILEIIFGRYIFKRYNKDINDSDHLRTPGFTLEFENYVSFDSVTHFVFNIDTVDLCHLVLLQLEHNTPDRKHRQM